jgi:hypothetical protein
MIENTGLDRALFAVRVVTPGGGTRFIAESAEQFALARKRMIERSIVWHFERRIACRLSSAKTNEDAEFLFVEDVR